MNRHIKDKSKTSKVPNRAGAFIEKERQQLRQNTRRKLLDHPHPVGNERVVQYAAIERGREA